jgi:hypothetical protein
MANPNIVNVTSILGGTLVRTPSSTAAVSILNNAASSGTVVKINSLVAANTSGTAVNCTVSYYTNETVEGSAPSGGTAFPIASTVSVPANASLVIIEKSNGVYLLEDNCISVTSGTANNLTFSISYEVIS